MSNECKHGQLKRSCNICELELEILGLKAQVELLIGQGDIINKTLWDLIRGAITRTSCIDVCQPWITLVSETPEECLKTIDAITKKGK